MNLWLGPFAAGLLFVTGVVQSAEVGASSDDGSSTPVRRRFAFNPAPYGQCDYFIITEFSASVVGRTTQDPVDSFLFSDGLGLMRNVGERSSLGGSVDAHIAQGEFKLSPTVRYKHWLSRRQSMDLLVGYMLGQRDGMFGPIATVRYSPAPYLHLQAGACQERRHWTTYDFQSGTLQFHDRKQFRVYGGLGLGGVPGLVSWGAQAVGGLALLAVAARMY
jgi:hypothetical protein